MARISLGGYGPSRRVKTLYGATRDAVAKQLTKALRERDTGKTLQGNTPTLQAFVETWRAGTAAALKPSTQGFYRDNLDNHILPLLGHHRVEALRRKDVVRLIRLCREKGLKVRSVRGIVRTLSTVLSDAVEHEYLDSNPALNVRKHLRQGDELVSEPDPFSTEDAQTFAETARLHFPRWYPFILCGLRTGLRLGELLALEWRDLDWRARTILVERNVVRGALTTPKSHQRRLVDMSPQLAAVLRLARRQRRIEFLRYGMPLPDAIFPSTEGTRLDESNVRKTFAKICTQAELRHRSPHDLRHTYASLLLSAGAPILYVSQQLGHQDAVITLRTYAQWMPKADPHAHSALLDTGRPLPR
jgi:integrase